MSVALEASLNSAPLSAQLIKIQSDALNTALFTIRTPLPRVEEKDVFEVAVQGAEEDEASAGPLRDCKEQESRVNAAAPPTKTADQGPGPGGEKSGRLQRG